MRFFGFRGFPNSFPFFRTFPVKNLNLPNFPGLFWGFPGLSVGKGGVTKERTILYTGNKKIT